MNASFNRTIKKVDFFCIEKENFNYKSNEIKTKRNLAFRIGIFF